MEPESEHTGMRSLLEHDAANTSFPLGCALEHGRTELRDERMRMRGPHLCPEVSQRIWFWFAVGGHRQEAEDVRCPGACLPNAIPSMFGHCFGAYATPGGRLVLLLCYAPSGLRFPSATDPP
jgi:hypothetical protein